jgi:lipoprotein-anchoring transpeptidase ErfK/SrfK
MRRSRRRASRGLVLVLALAILVSAVFILRTTLRGDSPAKEPVIPTLSVMDVGAAAPAAQTQPSETTIAVTPDAPSVIQTSTPTSPVASAPVPSPATQPANPTVAGTAWSQLLTSGSTDPAAQAPKDGPIVTGKGPLADGQARVAAGQIVDARAVVNEALQSGKLSDADTAAAKSLVAQINQTAVFGPRAAAGDAYCATYSVRSGDSLARIAANYQTTWDLLARINHLDPRRLRYGTNIKVIRGPFFAVVTKKTFTMDIYLGALPGGKGSMYVTSFSVGLGRDDSTPTGLWAIGPHAKLRHPTYYPPEGGQPIEADDPSNPLGGYWIGLTGVDGQAVGKSSYGIHGTIEPNSIGHQASMGCIRLRADDIAMVFDLLVEGKSMVLVKA